MLMLPIIIFFAVSCAVIAMFLLLAPDRTDQRLRAFSKNGQPARTWATTIVDVTGPFAKLTAPVEDWEASQLRLKFLNAGIRHASAPIVYFGLKTMLPLILASVTFVMVRASGALTGLSLTLAVAVAALAGCYLPNFVLRRVQKERMRNIFENFPDAADLLLICVEAGLGLDAAFTRVAEEILPTCPGLAEELQLTNLEMRAGGAREKALRNLALRTGVEELSSFATMMTQADRFGTSVAESLRVFSDDLRHKRQMRAEEQASKVPTKMLFPLVVFIFPSIVMVVLGPAIIQVVRTVMPLLAYG
jgi:tight adherence protein C